MHEDPIFLYTGRVHAVFVNVYSDYSFGANHSSRSDCEKYADEDVIYRIRGIPK